MINGATQLLKRLDEMGDPDLKRLFSNTAPQDKPHD